MNILHLFSGYNTFSIVAKKHGHNIITVDIKNYRGCEKQTYLIDFMFFDYKKFDKNYFDFILIGFPCTTFSKASGMYHFLDNAIPITTQAHKSLEMIERMFDIIDYFDNSIFLIENPVSALFSNVYYMKMAAQRNYNHFRIYQYNYGHLLAKHTEFITNSEIIWLDNTIYRKKGKFQKHKIDKISLRKRQSYPLELCERIIDYAENSIK